ncbi:transporter substrate-binding domain-containing protein [Pseudoalteromonas sp. DL2-H2.2]|uniref:substrate-binding periplasmic protein n=1 Tax=Pseudoalteromonas sp. DL2-H2.2 TaxID=2908889 RepID=UPI001F37B284|nr:transporter substrate-binding domain-containing protein [Pseudoalteromonas sp. DL2-H2.2]MCF2909386.1 transporter substrate-binding domain-containing protein [Pseudoalteromonas sp. DL2-H2.2]
MSKLIFNQAKSFSTMSFALFVFFSVFTFHSLASVTLSKQLSVIYRDYKGTHTVSGKKVSDHTFRYNLTAPKQVDVTTLEWQPYIGQSLCKQGWVMQAVIALLHSQNYGATVTFYPWARAVANAENGKVDILVPEYFIEPEAPSDTLPGTRRLDHLTLTEPFGWGPIALYKRRDYNTDHFTSLGALADERIGVVRGYQNTPEFDRLMDAGKFNVIEAVDDAHNIRLLMAGRVNLIIGDPEVIEMEIAALSQANNATSQTKNLVMVDPILQMNGLFFAVSKHNKYGKTLLFELNQAIAEFKKHGIMEEIKYNTAKSCE